jgi:hypothetical protein
MFGVLPIANSIFLCALYRHDGPSLHRKSSPGGGSHPVWPPRRLSAVDELQILVKSILWTSCHSLTEADSTSSALAYRMFCTAGFLGAGVL